MWNPQEERAERAEEREVEAARRMGVGWIASVSIIRRWYL